MMAELSPVSGGFDAGETSRNDEVSGKEAARKSLAQPSNVRRLFQDDVFERAARRPLVALG